MRTAFVLFLACALCSSLGFAAPVAKKASKAKKTKKASKAKKYTDSIPTAPAFIANDLSKHRAPVYLTDKKSKNFVYPCPPNTYRTPTGNTCQAISNPWPWIALGAGVLATSIAIPVIAISLQGGTQDKSITTSPNTKLWGR